MSDTELAAKQAYFEEQSLLDISDDEKNYNDDAADELERAMAEMPPPKLVRNVSSFLGATPKEVQADFEAHTLRRRTIMRDQTKTLTRSATTPEAEVTQSFPVTKPRTRQLSTVEGNTNSKMKRVVSLPNINGSDQTPFYIHMGMVPRELKNGKNAKPVNNIKLEPESKQLLRGKVVYFYPNDDIGMVRRTQIHKVIQLGAAWVTKWRDDITHVLLNDANYTYPQLLRHLNRAGFPKKVVLAKFDPYIPQSIQFGTLMDPSATRFSIKGAPQRGTDQIANTPVPAPEYSDESQISLKIKPSKKQKEAIPSQKTDSVPTDSTPSQTVERVPESPLLDRVEDSFVMPESESGESSADAVTPDAAFGEELLQAIRETKAIAHLPIDDDEDERSPTPSIVGADDMDSGTDDEPLEILPKARKKISTMPADSTLKRPSRKGFDQSGFQCMDPSTSDHSSQNPNARTIQVLTEMGHHYDQMQDQWRTLAYRKAVTTLKKQPQKISTAREASQLPSIGSRLASKIEEIVLTNRLQRLESTKSDPLDCVLRLFLGVYGAGIVQANKWIQAGHRTLSDLSHNATLTPTQRIGVAHYTDFNTRIPRAEVAAHGQTLTTALHAINPSFRAIIMGSYRRGATDSGDIDMLITCPGASLADLQSVVFNTLIPRLFATGFLTASLATARADDPTGTKWHGASCLPGSSVWRRLDVLVVPEQEIGAALLYFTGNDIFNRSMRLLARKKGMRLNQKGLYDGVRRGRRGEKLNEGVRIEGQEERGIFKRLGVPWTEPEERVC